MPRPAAAKKTPTTYREAYAVLARVAGELESGEADLDRVLPLIQEAQAAYQVCRERIEALQAALGEIGTADEDQADDEEQDREEETEAELD
ncbi:exodeoxyribonuclease VII small subunit [Deinococcus sp.]|uniref:exodeoxyribonuclease VII small subunit n=1 Tax=Deinococcus sp. TaxID=47478 RepID=UPI003C7D4032